MSRPAMRLAASSLAAAALLAGVVGLGACPSPSPARPAAAAQPETTMTDVTVRLLPGDLGERLPSEGKQVRDEPVPIMVWAPSGPAGVFSVQTTFEADTERFEQGLVLRAMHTEGAPPSLVGGSAGGDPAVWFEVVDLNGDGREELVVVRQGGAVEVIDAAGRLQPRGGPAAGGSQIEFGGGHVTRAAGKDEVLLWYRERPARGAPPQAPRPHALHLTASGLTAIRLDALKGAHVVGLAVLPSPSDRPDGRELVVLSSEGGKARASRHRLDGAPIEPPRALHLPLPATLPSRLEVSADGRVVVALFDEAQRAIFLEPRKPANWLRSVDLGPVAQGGQVSLLGLAEAGGPVVLAAAAGAVFAVDAEGQFHVGADGGERTTTPTPLATVADDAAGGRLLGFFPSRSVRGALMAVQARPGGHRAPSLEGARTAVESLLVGAERDRAQAMLTPSVQDEDPLRELLMQREAQAKGLQALPTSDEAWRAQLPDSYQAAVRSAEERFPSWLVAEVTLSAGRRETPRKAEKLAWLAALSASAQTTFTRLHLGKKVSSHRVRGTIVSAQVGGVPWPLVSWNPTSDGAVLVTALSGTDGDPASPARFAVVTMKDRR